MSSKNKPGQIVTSTTTCDFVDLINCKTVLLKIVQMSQNCLTLFVRESLLYARV